MWIRQILPPIPLLIQVVSFQSLKFHLWQMKVDLIFQNGSESVTDYCAKIAISYSLFASELLNKHIGVTPLIKKEITDKLAKLDKNLKVVWVITDLKLNDTRIITK